MLQNLQTVIELINNNSSLSQEEKTQMIASLKEADRRFSITEFKLDRTEKVKRTTAILLEETIEELEQKRKAVEAQNRELEIEASLERVRAVVMSMMKPDDLLEVSKVQFNELKQLSFTEMRNALIDIFHDDKNYFTDYDYSDFSGGSITDILHNKNAIIDTSLKQLKSAANAFTEFIVEGKELEDWKAFRKQNGEYDDTRLKDINALYYYFYSIEQGNVGLSTFRKISGEQLNILNRFRNVFDLAYKRYIDITNAETQAREAQIQLALERVRARTMAMQKSDELGEAASLLFQQIKSLGIESYSSGFTVWENSDNELISWMCNADGSVNPPFKIPAAEIEWHRQQYESWKRKEDYIIHDFTGMEMQDHFRYLRSFPLLDDAFKKSEAAGVATPVRQVHNAFNFSNGNLVFITLQPVPEAHGIFKRFARVFEQTYTRFLDLQKAEAQAREAQIEAALEKVRSRSLAMHKSDELNDVVMVLFERLKDLQIPATTAGIAIYINGSKDMNMYVCGEVGNGLAINNYLLPYFDHPITNDLYHVRNKGLDYFVGNYSKEEKDSFYDYVLKLQGMKDLPGEIKSMIMQSDSYSIAMAPVKNSMINLNDFGGKPLSENEADILKRFAKVFEQTYVRFLDLQKAEAQSRESQIQLALERLRARTMAMQHSNELLDAATLLFQQIKSLGTSAWNCSFNIWTEDKKQAIAWNATKEGFGRPFNSPCNQDVFQRFYEASLKGEELYVEAISGDALKHHYDYLSTLPGVGETLAELKAAGVALPTFQIFNIAYFTQGYLMFITYEPVPELWDIFKRFAKVFEQTYTRFLDLQKAEAQAREAEIQLALERVRARTMAMQYSDELADASFVLDGQVRALGIKTRGCAFNIYGENDSTEWFSSEMGTMPAYKTPRENIFLPYYEAGQKGESLLIKEFSGKACAAHYEYLCTLPVMGDALKQMIADGGLFPKQQVDHVSYFKYGYLLFITLEPVPEAHDIFKRFASVFEQTYTRFLDLQKAEAQAREAQIEGALERVRSKSLAMHKTSEIQEVIHTVHDELLKLNISIVGGSFIVINKDVDAKLYAWGSGGTADTTTKMLVPDFGMPFCTDLIKGIKKGSEFFTEEFSHQEKIEYFTELFKHDPWTKLPAKDKQAVLESEGAYTRSVSVSKHTSIFIINQNGRKFTEAENDIVKRFAKVFEQTYTRFLDLQKAEAQARESQIQLALERVRARTMAMQKSDELTDVADLLFEQVDALGIKTWTAGFNVWSEDNNTYEDYITSPEGGFIPPYIVDTSNASVLREISDARKKGDEFFVQYAEGQSLKETYIQLAAFGDEKQYDKMLEDGVQFPSHQYNHFVFGSKVSLMFITYEPVPEAHEIFIRLGNVFEQTYTRFLDLQKAEAQTKEAQIEAALERIRSRTLAMQKSDELAETSAVLFKQLILLGISPNRLYISIMKDDEGETEFWITDEDGSRVSLAYEDNLNNNPSFKKMFDGWKQQKKWLVIDMKGKELQQYFKHLSSIHVTFKGGLSQKRRWQYIAYFSKGFIGMASPDEQPKKTIDLLERFAYVFNLTFTRFNDLKVAEAHALQAEHDLIEIKSARQNAENALAELQSTQKQLIQSEKMASLGELTAGIAHEIQNPLNFVNNFSEVNKELIEELKSEKSKLKNEEIDELLDHIAANEEKINHHGKRADAIVKCMLQHSRAGTDKKEPTEINALCDEYLRLGYHGLRAKDKSFNAKFTTDFDESIGEINIVPQDIGRVILNLLTNAFYAVNEKKKACQAELVEESKYEPTVSISTRKVGAKIQVKVADNGNGIPQKVLDKIFQPFFTTKPTGQGTGLGLSLSYDIIKAHGGEIKVEPKEDEGTTFIIQLPIS